MRDLFFNEIYYIMETLIKGIKGGQRNEKYKKNSQSCFSRSYGFPNDCLWRKREVSSLNL